MPSKIAAAEPLQLSADEQTWLAAHQSIRIAFDGYFPPYSYLNDNGEFEGLAVDVMQLLAVRIGVKLEPFPQAVWKDLYAAAQRREVDLVATMGNRPERAEWFLFTRPYIFKSLVIMTQENAGTLESPADLAGQRVALVRSYQYVAPLLQQYPSIQPDYVDTLLDGLNAVAVGKADATITFLGAAHYLMTRYQIANLKFAAVFEKDKFSDSIGIRNDWPELASILDKGLASISDEEMQAISHHWIPPQISPGFSPHLVYISLAAILALIIVMALVFSIWNRLLKQQVRLRTADLQQELRERQKAELALSESESRLKAIFNATNDALFIHELETGAILDVNRKTCEMFGLSHAEMLRVEVESFSSGLPPYTQEDALDWLRKAANGEPQLFEWQAKYKNGQLFWIEVNMCRAAIGPDERIIVSARDITTRKQAEEALNVSELRFREVLENVQLVAVLLDINGKVSFCNDFLLKLTGRTREEMLGSDWFDRMIPEAHPEVKGLFLRGLKNGEIEPYFENPISAADQTLRHILWNNTILRDAAGLVIGTASIGEDITARKQAELEMEKHHEQLELMVAERTVDLQKSRQALQFMLEDLNEANARLREIDQLKSMFIASMSHELRTPLNAVIGFSSILLNEWTGPLNDEQKQNVGAVLRSGRHLLSLINDVIDLSKVEAGMLEVHRDNFDLAELLAEVEQTLAKPARDQNLVLTLPQPHLTLTTDRRRLLQCLINLTSNGLKYTEQGGVRVEIEQNPAENAVTIRVIDTGIGISEKDQGRLFKPFTRIPSEFSANVTGTGLGLYLTKKIVVEILQGTLMVTSEPGKGSSFSIRIPCRMDEHLQRETMAAEEDSA